VARASISPEPLLAAALGAAVGAALVLDVKLRIVLATPRADAVLGFSIPLGESAPKLLCGNAAKRPVAEALAEGRAVVALIPRPTREGDTLLKVRSVPLPDKQGWLLLLDEAGAHAAGPVLFHGMWSQTSTMKEVFRIVERVAQDDVTVLVRGETGTGKELVARAVHELSVRAKGPFRAINCAALPGNLLESELFGHARGAFTGAVRDTPGHVQLAHKGTLFLDEVAELPLELQAKLLRVLETRSVIPVGGREPIPVDTRIVSATHRSLRQEVEAGRFRADLMFRLRVIPIFLPPLRQRRQDIGLLCDKMIELMAPAARRKLERVSPSALALLERYDWPGNVRELANVLAYAFAIGDGPILTPSDLPPELFDPSQAAGVVQTQMPPEPPAAQDAESRRILSVLERTGGNKQQAAQILGMSRVTLWRRLKALGEACESRSYATSSTMALLISSRDSPAVSTLAKVPSSRLSVAALAASAAVYMRVNELTWSAMR
jgi:DNA-binding NtrC family response regulator